MPSILKDLRLNNSYSCGEKKIYYNLWIVQPITLYLSPETKFSKATTIKKWVVKLFICFYRPPCATHCAEHDAIYKWEQWWMGQFGLMWRSWEVGSEEVGGGSTFKQTLHSNSCDSFMSFSWPVARSHILVILIGLSNTQIFDHDLVKSSYDFRLLLSPHGHNKQSLDYFGGVGYCNSPSHEVLMISRFFAQFLTRVQLSKFYLSAGYLNQMKIFSLQNKGTF